MKFCIIIGDGMADHPVPELNGRTPLQAARIPVMDGLAARGLTGRVRTVPEGVPAGSDTAILSICGYDPRRYYTGRAPLEAAGSGVPLTDGDVAYRCNMVTLEDGPPYAEKKLLSHNGGSIDGESSERLMRDLLADDGCFWIHLDWHVVHYVKVMLDEIFGEKNFVNEVVWHYKSGGT
ncbi:MAG: hypothetical protein FWD39_06395, partial [Clostridiales bacterium]|nr:hypothetical protein [Clostridiales bacterium]